MPSHYTRLQWRHGQPYSAHYDDVFASRDGGEAEAQHVFIDGNRLPQRFAAQKQFCVGETGFGTGLNFLLTVQSFLQHADDDASLDFVSVEKHLLHPDDVARCHAARPALQPLVAELLACYPPALAGVHRCMLCNGRVRLSLLLGEAAEVLANLDLYVDAWFLDGFSPARNPAMWSQPVCDALARYSHEGTSLSSYSVAGVVRRGLQQAGFELQKRPGYGRKRDMLTGRFTGARQDSAPPWYRLPQLPREVNNAVIIGAGIAGLTTAWQLVQRGYRITLIDRAPRIASAASGNPAAVVMPRLALADDGYNALVLQALYFARRQYRSLQADSERTFWFEHGVQLAVCRDRAGRLLDDSHPASACLCEHASAASDTDIAWLLCRDAGWLRPRVLCDALLAACGDALHYVQAEVSALQFANGRSIVLDGGKRELAETGCLILANANGLATLPAAKHLPLQASRGQISLLPEVMLQQGLQRPLSGSRYITPPLDGYACAGASYGSSSSSALQSADHADTLAGLTAMAPDLLRPGIEPHSLRGRVAWRAVTPDRLPLIGPLPDAEYFRREYHDLHHGRPASRYASARYHSGVYVNAGYGSHGFSLAFLGAELLASMIGGTPLPVTQPSLQRLLPARFLVRALRRNRLRTG